MTKILEDTKDGYLFTFSRFEPYPVIAAFGTRKLNLGFGTVDDPESVIENRKKFLGLLGIDHRNLVCLDQIHGSKVASVGEFDRGLGALDRSHSLKETDGAVCSAKGVPIAIFTADCFPTFFFDPLNNAIGLCHAGWRGSASRIAQKVIKTMRSNFGTNAGDLLIAFGPGIRSCCYTVGEELADYFPGSIERQKGAYHLDLAKENLRQILDCGAMEKNIFDCGLCTSCRNDTFFSYRKEKENAGRMMAVMMLK